MKLYGVRGRMDMLLTCKRKRKEVKVEGQLQTHWERTKLDDLFALLLPPSLPPFLPPSPPSARAILPVLFRRWIGEGRREGVAVQ